jgi:hypothetical protein
MKRKSQALLLWKTQNLVEMGASASLLITRSLAQNAEGYLVGIRLGGSGGLALLFRLAFLGHARSVPQRLAAG